MVEQSKAAIPNWLIGSMSDDDDDGGGGDGDGLIRLVIWSSV